VDVTKRYTRDMQARYRLRGAVSETWLRQELAQLTNELRSAMLPDEVRQLEAQDELEQAELNKPAIDVGESLPGRSTGSYAWRKARGELGNL
jgi:peptide-N4-(N-acetyl-beta-glucosaminyl)asparagine amidase